MKLNPFCIIFVLLFFAIALPSDLLASKRPNVVFIFTDDQRPDAFGAVGNPDVKTPNMDRLFHNGFVFNQAYIQGSMTFATCLPSRAMLMSGKSLFRAPMRLDSGTILPQALRMGGYHTFATGKWHNGELSFENSFDEAEAVFFGGAARSHIGVPVHRMIAGLMVPYDSGESFSTELFADAAIDYIESREKSDKPFFCYIPFTAPHSPVTPPGRWATMYNPEKITLPPNHALLRPDLVRSDGGGGRRGGGRGGRGRGGDDGASPVERAKQDYAKYYGLISHLDHHIGRVLDTLEKTGQADNTIVLLATDHGMSKSSHGESGKNNAYEHTSRVQMVFSGATIPKGSSNALVYLYDIYPTLCGLAELPTPGGVEGKSLSDIIHGKADTVRDHLFTAYMQDQRAIRDSRWKLFHRMRENRLAFYDLKNDPHELNDLAQRPEHAKRIDELKVALAKARLEYGDTDEAVARLMRSRGGRSGGRASGRPSGRTGVRGRGPSGELPAVVVPTLVNRLAKVFMAHVKIEEDLANRDFETAWFELYSVWKADGPTADRRELVTGFSLLLDNDSDSRTASATGAPTPESITAARAFSYATDSDGDREISAAEVRAAAKKWAAEGDKNGDGKLNVSEMTAVIEGFFQSLPANRGTRRPTGQR